MGLFLILRKTGRRMTFYRQTNLDIRRTQRRIEMHTVERVLINKEVGTLLLNNKVEMNLASFGFVKFISVFVNL